MIIRTHITLAVFLFGTILNAQNSKAFVEGDQLNINNIIATINANGRLFTKENQPPDATQPGFELIDADGKHSIHAATLWMGAMHENTYYMCAPSFGQSGSDIFVGPAMDKTLYKQERPKWNRVWKITKEGIDKHKLLWSMPSYSIPNEIKEWPAHGDVVKGQTKDLAPFVDANHNGFYDPQNGDYPEIKGDQAVLFIYNDMAGPHTESRSFAIGVEVVGLAYAFDKADKTYNNTVFVDYLIRNRSGKDFKDVKLGVFTDTDLGKDPYNDYAGCDPKRQTYYGYNANRHIRQEVFGKSRTPFQAVTLLNKKLNGFMAYDNDWTFRGNPFYPMDFFCYLHNGWKDGRKLSRGDQGRSSGKEEAFYMYDGSPLGLGGWNEKSLDNKAGDRRGLGLSNFSEFKNEEVKLVSVAYSFSIGLRKMQKNTDKILKHYANGSGPFYNDENKLPETNIMTNDAAMSLYPNPMDNYTTISYNCKSDIPYDIRLLDISGKQVRLYRAITDRQFKLDRKGLNPGVYFVELKAEEGTLIEKLIIN